MLNFFSWILKKIQLQCFSFKIALYFLFLVHSFFNCFFTFLQLRFFHFFFNCTIIRIWLRIWRCMHCNIAQRAEARIIFAIMQSTTSVFTNQPVFKNYKPAFFSQPSAGLLLSQESIDCRQRVFDVFGKTPVPLPLCILFESGFVRQDFCICLNGILWVFVFGEDGVGCDRVGAHIGSRLTQSCQCWWWSMRTKYLFECFRIMIFFVSKKYQEMGWWSLVEHNRGKSRLNFNQIDTARRGSGQNNPFKLCQSIFLNSTLLTRQYFKSKIFYFKFNSIGRQMTQNLTFVIWTKIF